MDTALLTLGKKRVFSLTKTSSIGEVLQTPGMTARESYVEVCLD